MTPANAPLILVAEDDAQMRTLLRKALEREGFGVLTASDGVEALEILRTEEEVSLLLTDIRMPRMDGLQLLEHARTERPDLRIVLMTAYAELDQYLDLLRKGAFDYLPKPFKIPDLLSAVERALGLEPGQFADRRGQG